MRTILLLAAASVLPSAALAQSCYDDGDCVYGGTCEGTSTSWYCDWSGCHQLTSAGQCENVPQEGDWDYCIYNECGLGEGDCDSDSECAPSLLCQQQASVDTCEQDWDYCNTHVCNWGEGDCDRDSDCPIGMVCAQNRGASFGQEPTADVCLWPWN